CVLLVFAVDDLAHAFDEETGFVFVEQRVPLAAPEHFDDVPTGAAEDGFELLNDVPVASHGAVEALEIAVDDKNQVVELLTRREGDRAECFRFIRLAVTEKRPDLRIRALLQASILEVAHEARLIDRHDRAE